MKAQIAYHRKPSDPKEQLKFVASLSKKQQEYLDDILIVLKWKAGEKYGIPISPDGYSLINDCKARSEKFYEELYGWQRRCYDEWLHIHMKQFIEEFKKGAEQHDSQENIRPYP